MTFKIKDAAEFGLFVNDVDMAIAADALKDVTVIQNVHSPIPTLSITFLDMHRSANSAGAFVDGVPISVLVGDGKTDPVKYKFRQWSLSDATANTAGDLATLTGIADEVPWFRKIVSKNYKDTASDVIKAIAKEAGIKKTDIDSTQDKMNWLPDARTLSQFARRIIDHSWAGEMASMMLALTFDDKGETQLRLKDILKKGSAQKRLASAGLAERDDFIIWDYRIKSMTGMMNAWTNYGHKVVQEQLEGAPAIFKSMNVQKIAQALGINSQVQQVLDTVRTFYHPPDVGNCQAGETLIPTERGLVRIDSLGPKKSKRSNLSIRVGSRYTPVQAKTWFMNGVRPTLFIGTDLGNMLHCTYRHGNLIFDQESGNFVWRSAIDCRVGDLLCINLKQIVRKRRLQLELVEAKREPCVAPGVSGVRGVTYVRRANRYQARLRVKGKVLYGKDHTTVEGAAQEYKRMVSRYGVDEPSNWSRVKRPRYMTEDLAFILGVLVAEGHHTEKYLSVWNTNLDLLELTRSKIKRVFGLDAAVREDVSPSRGRSLNGAPLRSTKPGFNMTVGSFKLCSYLDQLGVYRQKNRRDGKTASHFKIVPWSILQADVRSQYAFLAAYLECDGSVGDRLSWYSVNRELLRQIQSMLNAMGFAPRLTGARTCSRLSLNRSESRVMWERLERFMPTKKLVQTTEGRSIIYGVPSKYWLDLISSRCIRSSRGTAPMRYLTDSRLEVDVYWRNDDGSSLQGICNREIWTYADYEAGKFDTLLRKLRLISESGYQKLVTAFKLRYRFNAITSIANGGKVPVYDLSMGDSEPAFIANGMIVHNTHDNYARAKHHNTKARALFTTEVHALTAETTKYKLLDDAEVLLARASGKPDPAFSMTYKVSAIAKHISKASYREKLVLTGQGTNADLFGQEV